MRIGLLPLALLAGCHSPFINATIENGTGGVVSPVEVDYPSASFGTESLATGAAYRYRFKVLGSGGTKVSWTDARHQEHTTAGPPLQEGQEGSLHIVLGSTSATWTSTLKP